MSLASPYQEHYYIADGETTSFSFGEYFSAPASANVKCIIYFEDGTSCVPSFNVDITTGYIDIIALTTPDGQVLNAPPAGSSVRVFRDTPEQQNITASQLQNYTAKQLEKIFDSIVAMIQENTYTTEHKTLRLTETQRDVFLAFLKEANDDALLYWDNETKTIVPTDFVRQDVVRMAGGLFFRAKNDSQLRPYLEWSINGQTDWNSLNLWVPVDTANEAKATADEALDLAQSVQSTLSGHLGNTNNPHETSLGNLTDTDFTNLSAGNFIMFDGLKWKNVFSTVAMFWGDMQGDIFNQTDLVAEFAKKVNKSGDTMTGDLSFQYNANNPVLRIIQSGQDTNHLRFINNSYASQSVSFDLTQAAIHPLVTGRGHLGTSDIHFGDAHIDKVYTPIINNGYDISVPETNSADTFALKSQVDDAANSGEQLYTTGVWFAKMYSASVVPTGAEYDGKNYADFSQVDNDNNPIVVIYEGQSGSWVEIARITPPANHVAYLTITSKIWDIAEQTDQQGGEVLWSYNQKTFTPYPKIVRVLNQANTDLSNLTSTGKANISTQGTYDPNETYNAGTVGEAITGKADTSLDNVSAGIDFVVESQFPTAENNYTWYRKYKSGWVEQGGRQTGATSGSVSVSLPVTMADANYFVQVTSTDKSLFGSGSPDTTTQVTMETRGHDYSVQPCKCVWQVSGMSAS